MFVAIVKRFGDGSLEKPFQNRCMMYIVWVLSNIKNTTNLTYCCSVITPKSLTLKIVGPSIINKASKSIYHSKVACPNFGQSARSLKY